MSGLRTTTRFVLVATWMIAGVACTSRVTQTSDSRPLPPAPRALPLAPEGARADTIVLQQVAAKPLDTNGNGYPDQIQVLANLFSDEADTPIYEAGTFIFRLYYEGQAEDPDALPLREWRITSGEMTRTNRIRTIYGPTYRFYLSLIDTGGDRFPIMTVDLACAFEPDDGRATLHRRQVHKLQIGAAPR